MADPNQFTLASQLTKGLHRDIYAGVEPSKLSSHASGKVVLIAGASGGLGFAIAKTWFEAGAKGIVLVARDSTKLDAVVSELKLKDGYLLVAGDIIKEEDVKSAFDQAIAKFGTVDVVINAAGSMNNGAIGEISPSLWWSDYEMNVKAVYNLAHHFIASAGGKGTFINLVSLGASFLVPGLSSYSTATLARIRLAEYIDLEQPNLRTFSVHPGLVEATPTRGAVAEMFKPFAKDKPELTGAFTLYLLTPEADHLRGGFVSVNWDVDEMEKHKQEIADGKLLKLGFIGGKLGPEGHPWGQ